MERGGLTSPLSSLLGCIDEIMRAHRPYVRRCVCECHSKNTYVSIIRDELSRNLTRAQNRQCDNCEDCRARNDNASPIDAISLTSTITVDNDNKHGRPLNRFFQFMGGQLERLVGVGMDKLGYGPAAAERRALKAIANVSSESRYHIEVIRGKRIVKIPAASEVAQSENEIRKCCERLVEYSRCVVYIRPSHCGRHLIP
jgi:hypothetical protein